MAKQSISVEGLTPGQNYSIRVYAITTDADGVKRASPYSVPYDIETPAVSGNGSNFSLVNNGTDIALKGGSLLAGTFPANAGQIDVVNDTPDATGVVLNQSGIAGFNAGAKQFYISAVNGDAWFNGKITGSAFINNVIASDVVSNAAAGVLKNKTFYQNDAPTASQIGDLWYDTNDGYKAYRWSGSAWDIIQDGAIITAANAAAAAQSSADGKSRIIYGSAGSTATKGYAPNGIEYEVTLNGSIDTFLSSYTTTTGNKVGDTWFVRNNVGSIIAQYTVTSFTAPDTSLWTRTKVEGMVIGNLDAGKITVGTLSVGLGITTGTGNITLNASTGKLTATNVELTGAITATSGYLGSSTNGWIINSTSISSNGLTLKASGGSLGTAEISLSSGVTDYTIYSSFGLFGISMSGVGNIIGTSASTRVVIGNSTYGTLISSNLDVNNRITAAGTTGSRCNFDYFNIAQLMSISGGYGVDSDWSPMTDNTYTLGQVSPHRWQRVYANNTAISTSDARLKTDITDSPLGLDFINALRPVNYRWINGGNLVVKDENGNPIVESEDKNGKPIYKLEAKTGKRLHYGFIAQEVKQALDATGVEDFAGYVQDDLSDPESGLSLSYEQFIAPLVKAVQELTDRVKELENK